MAVDKLIIKQLAREGVSVLELARQFGVSRTRIYQILDEDKIALFKVTTEEQCIYPKWRNWMNENRVSKQDLLRQLGLVNANVNRSRLRAYMTGQCYPQKHTIDDLIRITGLTFEELFYREE
jgi:transcriptional regulator with XRE-family HTH domain